MKIPSLLYACIAAFLLPAVLPAGPPSLPSRTELVGFEENAGQFSAEADYRSRGLNYSTFLTKQGPALLLRDRGNRRTAALRIRFVDAQDDPSIDATITQRARFRHFGADRLSRTGGFADSVRYRGVYPGIDVVYRSTGSALEYDFVLEPGAEASLIALAVEGADSISVDEDGRLVVEAAGYELVQHEPFVYQDHDGRRQQIAGSFAIRPDGRIAFELGEYDRELPLVIDPVVEFSTYLGAGDTEIANAVAIDNDGAVYVTGRTDSSDLPITSGVFQSMFGGDESDVFLSKYNADGSLVFTAFYGSESTDFANDIALGDDGSIYITGQTESTALPVDGFDQGFSGEIDCFVAKFSNDGAQLEYASYLGDGDEDVCNAIAVNSSGEVYVAGYTISRDFPSTDGVFQDNNNGGRDAFVAKVSADGATLMQSTFLGGLGDDTAVDMAIDDGGNIYLVGDTNSVDLPISGDAAQNLLRSRDGFLAVLDANSANLMYSTFIGGGSDEIIDAIAVRDGLIAVAGQTKSNDFPLFDAFQDIFGENDESDIFVALYRNMGREQVFSSYFGGDDRDFARDIAIDSTGRVYVTGATSSENFRTRSNGFAFTENRGDLDAFLMQFSANAGAIQYAVYYGGENDDEGTSIAVNDSGDIAFVGFTKSNNFPLENEAQSEFNNFDLGDLERPTEAFVARVAAFDSERPFTVVSAASFALSKVAGQSIVSGYGTDLAGEIAGATSVPLPTTLGGVRVLVSAPGIDQREAELLYVSPEQVNFVMPDLAGLEGESAIIEVERDGQIVSTGGVRISRSQLNLFAANMMGTGTAAAIAVQGPDGVRTPIFSQNSSGEIEPTALDLSVGDTVLELYGTGLAGVTDVTATINGVEADVLYAGQAPGFVGLDQINVRIPPSLAGQGDLDIVLMADGQTSNTVTVTVQ